MTADTAKFIVLLRTGVAELQRDAESQHATEKLSGNVVKIAECQGELVMARMVIDLINMLESSMGQ